ncbi:MAG: ATPase P [Tissierellia bacterium]|nr:ATPase P [Tissierellia bacterium]
MISYEIPGRGTIEIKNLVLDYNGTIAVDGRLIEGVAQRINKLAEKVDIYVLTADTYGTVKDECQVLKAEVMTFPRENAGKSKREIVEGLDGGSLCLGNGFNDIPMFEVAALSIAILEGEGMAPGLLNRADILSRSILEALDIASDASKVKATLRN